LLLIRFPALLITGSILPGDIGNLRFGDWQALAKAPGFGSVSAWVFWLSLWLRLPAVSRKVVAW